MLLICKFKRKDEDIEKLINEFEEEEGFTLPQQFRDFMLKYNGGRTALAIVKFTNDESDIKGIYGFGDADEWLSFDNSKDYDLYDTLLSSGFLAIGDNASGDHFLIGIDGNKRGKIYFKSHEEIQRPTLVANSFMEFVDICKSKPIEKPRAVKESIKSFIEKGKSQEWIDSMVPLWEEHYEKTMRDIEMQEEVKF